MPTQSKYLRNRSSEHLLPDSFTCDRYDSQQSFGYSQPESPSSVYGSQGQEQPSRSFDSSTNVSRCSESLSNLLSYENKNGSTSLNDKFVNVAENEGNPLLYQSSSDFSKDRNAVITSTKLHRHLGVFDLVAIGVGATIGSGIFVLCGLIAHEYAGPATFISWGLAGVCASASGLCYAELSGKISSSGSSYAYVVSAI